MSKTLTPEQAKSLLDSLFALPDKVAKPKAVKKPEAKTEGIPLATHIAIKATHKPVLCITEVVHQLCTTCNTEHKYIRTRRVRFEDPKKGAQGTAFEIRTLVPEDLPRRVDHSYETTEICPTCLEFSTMFEDYLAVAQRPIQLELFHG